MAGIWNVLKKIKYKLDGGEASSRKNVEYIHQAPTDQIALDLFKGEWSSAMPSTRPDLKAGPTPLFEDPRVKWAGELLGGFDDLRVLELGPLEAGHSYIMEKGGAESILSVESHTSAYLRCLVVKEIFELERTRFLLGDFVEYLKTREEKFDFCLASGVLYHMKNPAELIELISKAADKVFLWTHYYDAGVIKNNRSIAGHFSGTNSLEHAGFKYTGHKQNYYSSVTNANFCGGTDQYSHWISREDILGCLRYFGYEKLQIGFEEIDHPIAPAFCIYGEKDGAVKPGESS